MSRYSDSRRLPHVRTPVPRPELIVLYYITRHLGRMVFVDTQLSIFCTPKWWFFVQDNCLPPSFTYLMEGTLQDTYGLNFPKGEPISIGGEALEQVKTWLHENHIVNWRRSYLTHRATVFRHLMGN